MKALVDYAGPDAPAACYRVVERRAVRTPIKLGIVDSENGIAEVLDGLKDGDAIVPDQRMITGPRPSAPPTR